MRPSFLSLLRWIPVLLLSGFLLACSDDAQPDVSEGQFTAHIEGGLVDTLTGSAVYRMEEGRLEGIELGERGEPGLSIELEAHPPDQRTYEVVEWSLLNVERSESSPGVIAFLAIDGARFEATRGTFEITNVEGNELGGTFDFEMEGSFGGSMQREASVRVAGSLRAREESRAEE